MSALITVERLEKSFPTPAGDIRVLRGIDATFSRGEMVSIVGASGVGMSTFLHILGALHRPTSGKLTYHLPEDGRALDPFTLGSGELALFRNRVVGFVFQFHSLLPEFDALENTMMPGLIAGSAKGSGRTRRVCCRQSGRPSLLRTDPWGYIFLIALVIYILGFVDTILTLRKR